MKILIVDDESLARERLVRLLNELNIDLNQLTEAENGIQALELLKNHFFDLILLDIRMPEIDGMQVAKTLYKKHQSPAIIFISAYGEYAVDAFGVEAIDYLLKPVRKQRLEQALKKVQMELEKQPEQFISIHERGNIQQLNLARICYFKADQKYVTVHTKEKEYLIEEALKSLETRFTDSFIRIHRNALVARKGLRGIVKNSSGHFCVRLKDCDDLLEISRRHISSIRKLLKNQSQ